MGLSVQRVHVASDPEEGMKMLVNLYIECSTRNLRKVKRRCGYVLECETKNGLRTKEIFFESEDTYHGITLRAIADGLKRVKPGNEVSVYVANEFIVNSFCKDMETWKENGFTNKNGKPVKNKDKWETLLDSMKDKEVNVNVAGSHQYSTWLMSEMWKREVTNIDSLAEIQME